MDIFSIESVNKYLTSDANIAQIHMFETLESTNQTAKEMALLRAEHGTVVVSNAQTKGRGRRGRDFFSPPQSGLYVSFILHADALQLTSMTLVTTFAAAAVCKAIERATGKSPTIKWVNDILLDGKKIGGILAETVSQPNESGVNWVVLGIGINIYTAEKDFPEEFRQIAGSLYENKLANDGKSRLLAEIINEILNSNNYKKEMLAQYKNRLATIGKMVVVMDMNETYEAQALDIDENGHLIVKKDDGSVHVLSSGEVSTRLPL